MLTVNTKKAIVISSKVDFKKKGVTRYKKGHFIPIEGAIYQEDVAITRLCLITSFKLHEGKIDIIE